MCVALLVSLTTRQRAQSWRSPLTTLHLSVQSQRNTSNECSAVSKCRLVLRLTTRSVSVLMQIISGYVCSVVSGLQQNIRPSLTALRSLVVFLCDLTDRCSAVSCERQVLRLTTLRMSVLTQRISAYKCSVVSTLHQNNW